MSRFIAGTILSAFFTALTTTAVWIPEVTWAAPRTRTNYNYGYIVNNKKELTDAVVKKRN